MRLGLAVLNFSDIFSLNYSSFFLKLVKVGSSDIHRKIIYKTTFDVLIN